MNRRRFLLTIAAQSATWQDEAFSPLNGSLAPAKAKGPFKLGKLIGRTLAVNQCLNYSGITSFPTTNGISCTISNGTLHYQGTATASGYMGFISSSVANQSTPSVQGHKYAFLMNLTGSIGTGFFSSASLSYTIRTDSIYTATSGTFYGQFRMIEGETYDFYITPKIHDLTLMFGPGREPTTVAEFRRVYSRENTAYTEGRLESALVAAIISKPYNLFDGELENGRFNLTTGTKENQNAYRRNVNKITVEGGKPYTFEFTGIEGASFGDLLEYDSSNNFIKATYFNTVTATMTTANATRYVNFMLGNSISSTINAKICFHLTGTRTGYAPQKQTVRLELPNDLTLNSALDAKDAFEVVGENAAFTKNVGTVDLGTLTWGRYSSSGVYYFQTTIADMKAPADYNERKTGCITSRYIPSSNVSYGNMDNKSWLRIGSTFSIRDDDYTDVTAFKTAMAGQYLNYELTTPQTITIPLKKLQAVTIGELEWRMQTAYGVTEFYSGGINSIVKAPADNDTIANVFCSECLTGTRAGGKKNIIAIGSNGVLICTLEGYTSATDFVAAHRDDVIWFESVNDQAEWNAGTCDAGGKFETGYVSPDAVLKIYERK